MSGWCPTTAKYSGVCSCARGWGNRYQKMLQICEWWDFDEDHEATLATEECGARARTRIRELFQEYSPRLNGDAGAQSGA